MQNLTFVLALECFDCFNIQDLDLSVQLKHRCVKCVCIPLRFLLFSLISSQFFHRSSSREFLQVMSPLFQKNMSFRQVMAAASSLVCGYTEGAFSRVTSFNWYEDNNYKAFLGIGIGRAEGNYTYDNSTSELIVY